MLAMLAAAVGIGEGRGRTVQNGRVASVRPVGGCSSPEAKARRKAQKRARRRNR